LLTLLIFKGGRAVLENKKDLILNRPPREGHQLQLRKKKRKREGRVVIHRHEEERLRQTDSRRPSEGGSFLIPGLSGKSPLPALLSNEQPTEGERYSRANHAGRSPSGEDPEVLWIRKRIDYLVLKDKFRTRRKSESPVEDNVPNRREGAIDDVTSSGKEGENRSKRGNIKASLIGNGRPFYTRRIPILSSRKGSTLYL